VRSAKGSRLSIRLAGIGCARGAKKRGHRVVNPAPARDVWPTHLFRVLHVQYEVGCLLRLCGSVNQKLEIVAKLLQPAGDVGGLIMNDRV